MDILVDFRCRPCASLQERWVAKPVPTTAPCILCGGNATRVFGASVRTSASKGPGLSATAIAGSGGSGSFYLDNRDVPGICHMSGSEARRWVSLARGDKPGAQRERERQERAIEAGTLDPSRPTAHAHTSAPPAPTRTSTTAHVAAGATTSTTSPSAPNRTRMMTAKESSS